MVDKFEEKYELAKPVKTPAAEHLFQVNKECSESNTEMQEDFCTHTAKLLFICKHGGLHTQTLVAFLTTRAIESDTDDWKKLLQLINC